MLRSRTAIAALLLAAACSAGDEGAPSPDTGRVAVEPNALPIIRSPLPFTYPAELYARKVEANVVLRLFVDSTGRVLPESTQVEESSGYTALDSAARSGAGALEFAPAVHDGAPVGVTVLLPVHFRHPDLGAAVGDTTGGGSQ